MSEPVLEVLVIFVLILAGGLFAMSETAIVSARKSRLEDRANKDRKSVV